MTIFPARAKIPHGPFAKIRPGRTGKSGLLGFENLEICIAHRSLSKISKVLSSHFLRARQEQTIENAWVR
jgi:hypothetical protein